MVQSGTATQVCFVSCSSFDHDPLFLEEHLLGGNPEVEEELQLLKTSDREDKNISSEAALSDTSDPDQANDIEELLEPGYPVYFNYPMPNATHTLQVNQHVCLITLLVAVMTVVLVAAMPVFLVACG